MDVGRHWTGCTFSFLDGGHIVLFSFGSWVFLVFSLVLFILSFALLVCFSFASCLLFLLICLFLLFSAFLHVLDRLLNR